MLNRRLNSIYRFDYLLFILSLSLVTLAGCGQNPDSTPRAVLVGRDVPGLILPGNQRILTVRSRPISGGPQNQDVLCSEPSPDWAAAYATAAQFSGSGSVPSGPAISAGGGYTFAETITQLAGRTAGVVALRDGLYAACQAYANGVLGQDAYSLILSQYGNLLVRLVSVSSASDAGGKPAAASSSPPAASPPSSTPVNLTTLGAGAAAQPSAGTPKASAPAASPADDPMTQARAQALGALIVACITEGDSTRLRGPTQSTVLTTACPALINNLVKEAPSLLQNPSPPIKPGGEAAIAAADPMVAAYQGVLQIEGLYKGKIDGRPGRETAEALNAYQTAHHLAVTGKADKPTLAEMKL
jgi:hypothetical protein